MNRFEYTQWAARANAVRGAALPHSKLNDELVREIRENRPGLTARQWGERLGLHYRPIEKVRHFETWSHV